MIFLNRVLTEEKAFIFKKTQKLVNKITEIKRYCTINETMIDITFEKYPIRWLPVLSFRVST